MKSVVALGIILVLLERLSVLFKFSHFDLPSPLHCSQLGSRCKLTQDFKLHMAGFLVNSLVNLLNRHECCGVQAKFG